MEFSYYNKKLKELKERIIDNIDGEKYCFLCNSLENLIEDEFNEEVFYCLECMSRSLKHDEMIINDYEESPDVGD